MKKILIVIFLLSNQVLFSQFSIEQSIRLEDAPSEINTDELRVHFIDIGPGLAMLIQTPSGINMFIDGGDRSLSFLEQYMNRFIPSGSEIDYAIVTHPDADHYIGMKKIFEKYEIGEYWYTGYKSPQINKGKNWKELQKLIIKENCIVKNTISDFYEVGDKIIIDDLDTPSEDDDVFIILLNVDSQPPKKDPVSSRRYSESQTRNNSSLVFKLVYKEISFLITGDINGKELHSMNDNEIDSEEYELRERHLDDPVKFNLESTVLQSPHHGSDGSNSGPFIKSVSPEWVVITAGHKHNHPHPETLDRLNRCGISNNKILRTDMEDSTPENSFVKDVEGDDSYLFQTDGYRITKLMRITALE